MAYQLPFLSAPFVAPMYGQAVVPYFQGYTLGEFLTLMQSNTIIFYY